MNLFYGQLAPWWPLLSPVEEYREEALGFLQLLHARRPEARSLLELGSGGGHLAHHLKARFECTLSDLSADMLAVSAALNPECRHVVGDLRTLALPDTFDLVLVHDAIGYMTTEPELRAALTTAWRHLRPGGLALFVPDDTLEDFTPTTECGGSDGPDGRAARITEWSEPIGPDGTVVVNYGFLLREADGTLHTACEQHRFGCFSEATWVRLLTEVGFTVEVVLEPPLEDHPPRRLFLATREECT